MNYIPVICRSTVLSISILRVQNRHIGFIIQGNSFRTSCQAKRVGPRKASDELALMLDSRLWVHVQSEV